ncbi:site-2 protease family protein [Candidatus Woesearchaeota archaeon]|nr:site-2 protease family protein [Candidatus Woesearchaeota archaeon]
MFTMGMQTNLAIAFLIGMLIFLWFKRKKIEFQRILFPIIYFILYRTKIGLPMMDRLAKKYPKTVRALSSWGIYFGFLGMAVITFELLSSLIKSLTQPDAAAPVALVLPIETGLKGIIAVPFMHWIISIFVIATVHEFSHGVVARLYGMKIKSSGFAFLSILVPIIPAAFVEPDDKEMSKKPKKQQLAVLAAGPFSNMILALIAFLIVSFAFVPAMERIVVYDGLKITDINANKEDSSVKYPAELTGMKSGEIITSIDGEGVVYTVNFTKVMDAKKPGEVVQIVTDGGIYYATLQPHPKNASKGYLGISGEQSYHVDTTLPVLYQKSFPGFIWLSELFMWLFILNLGIGLFNLVPIGPIDGGRMMLLAMVHYFGEKKGTLWWKRLSIGLLALILALIALAFIR